MEKFKEGDVIVLRRSLSYGEEVGREQVIKSIDLGDYSYITEFLDDGSMNGFGFECEYARNCYLVRSVGICENSIWKNGIPTVWGDDL